MNERLVVHGEATVRLTNKKTGRVVREITARNKLNSDYVAEIKNNLFNPTNALTLFLSEYDLPSPDNGLIFPMGRFLGYGKYGLGSTSIHQGIWSAVHSKQNQQENGLTTSTFTWDFTSSQAVGTLRSLFLYWDAHTIRYPAVTSPTATWKGTPRCFFESKLYDTVAKTETDYYVADYFTKEVFLRKKANTLTVSGLAYDLDSGHIFVFDFPDKKIYEFANLDVDMTMANVLATYPCTQAHFSRGLIRNGNLYYITGMAGPASTASASYQGSTFYLHKYAYTTDSVPALLDTMTCAEFGQSNIGFNLAAAFMDDYLIYHFPNNVPTYAPVLRLVGENARMGIIAGTNNTTYFLVRRPSKNTQVLYIGGTVYSPNTYTVLPMAISHLLLPVPFVKDDNHGLSLSYTISIQE